MLLEELRWKKYPVGHDGFVCLVDVMGDDSSIVQAARVSYGSGTKTVSDDRTLIRYLYRQYHSTPFEMVEFKFLVRVPMDAWRQWIRHRTASVNEYSTRYSVAINACDTTSAEKWRLQSDVNKQGSGAYLQNWPAADIDWTMPAYLDEGLKTIGSPGAYLTEREHRFHEVAREVYEERLKFGVAREQARKDLPLSNYTEAYWKIDLKNLMNFLSLRQDSHAQLEIREYADVIYDIVKQICPLAIEAYDDYDFRRKGVLLSDLDVQMIKQLMIYAAQPSGGPHTTSTFYSAVQDLGLWPSPPARCRERDECLVKLIRLGIVSEAQQNVV